MPNEIESERIAMEMAAAYEIAHGTVLRDVSTADEARSAGLTSYPGFDLLSKRLNEVRSIEVKGRAGRPSVTLEENEWVQACTLKECYWLYCLFDCGTSSPKLLKVQDPFNKLIAKSRGSFEIAYGDLVRVAEEGADESRS